jgi:membrane protease subunit (stomatin/prohibitin family)
MAMSVIEFQDSEGEIIVARIPTIGTGEFVTGSQLIVQDGQFAVFFRDGQPADAFKAGRYTLETKNLPIISKLVNFAAYGGKSPFRAYVYFVQLKTFPRLGWGTPQAILFKDPEFKGVGVRAFGSFSVRVSDPAVLLRTLVGSQGVETTFAIQDWLRRFIASRLAGILPNVCATVYEFPGKYEEIAVRLKLAVRDDLAQYGFELVDLLVESINLPNEVSEAINRAAGLRAYAETEIGRAKDLAIADALRDSAKQPGGGMMAGALGLGAGFAMAQQMAPGGASSQSQAAPPPPPAANVQWYVALGGQQAGPFAAEAIHAQIRSGGITRQTHVWRNGMPSWLPAGQTGELSGLFDQPPPPPAPGT